MDIRKLAAEKKARALADLKAAEAMEQDARQMERLALKHGWKIEIKDAAANGESPPPAEVSRVAPSPAPRKGGKVPDPNSTTARSKSESVKIIQRLNRPVPLSELVEKLAHVGVRLGGKKPNQALSANLGHCPDVVPTKRGWWLVGVKMPPEEKSPGVGRDDMLSGLN